MDEEPAASVEIEHHGADAEHRFVDGVRASQPGTMIYLDFYQQGPRGPDAVRGSVRLVMLPLLADILIDQLSALREAKP